MTQHLHFDLETRSERDLRKVGAHVYARHPSTGVHCLAYAVDNEPVALWLPGDPVPPVFLQAAQPGSDLILIAHNVEFDRLILEHILVPRYDFPAIPAERFRCSAAVTRMMALPPALKDVVVALDLPDEFRKDMAGARLMQQMAKPRKARKGEDPEQVHWHESVGQQEGLIDYNLQDVRAERAVWEALRGRRLSGKELEIWRLDQKINEAGFSVDRDLCCAALEIIKQFSRETQAELSDITEGAITAVSQVERTKVWLAGRGVTAESLTEESVKVLLERTDLPPDVRRVLELRQSGAQAAANKVGAFLNHSCDDGRARGAFIYYGARTGRWTSRGIQVHNLKRFECDNVADLIAAVHSRDIGRVRSVHPQPLELIGDLSRSTVIASADKYLLGADFSAIESRTLAWLSGEAWKLQAYRDYDAETDPKCKARLEPYSVLAARMLGLPEGSIIKESPERKTGKTADLACGYQGSEGAIERFAKGQFSLDERLDICRKWRAQHPATTSFWKRLQNACWDAIATRGEVDCGPVSFRCTGAWLRLRLPSGRTLYYPFPQNRLKDPATPESFYANWRSGWREETTYGGKLAENVTQAVARDVLAEAMLRLDAAGFKLIGHVHDEIFAEVPAGSDREKEFTQIMTAPPSWAAGLPIAAASWTGERFC
jgi:DNA polymerase bacteriophage-type